MQRYLGFILKTTRTNMPIFLIDHFHVSYESILEHNELIYCIVENLLV